MNEKRLESTGAPKGNFWRCFIILLIHLTDSQNNLPCPGSSLLWWPPFCKSTAENIAGNHTLTHTCFPQITSVYNNCLSHLLSSASAHKGLLKRVKEGKKCKNIMEIIFSLKSNKIDKPLSKMMRDRDRQRHTKENKWNC